MRSVTPLLHSGLSLKQSAGAGMLSHYAPVEKKHTRLIKDTPFNLFPFTKDVCWKMP